MTTREKDKTTREKDEVRDAIYAQRDRFVQLAHGIHAHPQLAFAEDYAAARIREFLADEGFNVRTGVYGLPTAFVATIGSGSLHIAFCAEYDALPSSVLTDRTPKDFVGLVPPPKPVDPNGPDMHACGHNLIAGAAVAAATGLQGIVDKVGLQVSVFGTPGEELYGLPEPPAGFLAPGKVVLLEAGAFEDVHAALMVHPWPTPYGAIIPSQDGWRVRAQFSSAGTGERLLGPVEMQRLEETLQQSVSSLHQIPFLCAVKPDVADIGWYGASSLAEGMRARDAVLRCFEEAASSSGVAVEVDEYAPGAAMRHDPMLAASYRKNAEALGRVREREKGIQEEVRRIKKVFLKKMLREGLRHPKKMFELTRDKTSGLFLDPPPQVIYGTDLGNVSWVIPAIHPYIGIGGFRANHTAEFAAQADTDEAYRAMVDGGVALAWTALDAATDPALNAYLLEAASSRARSSPPTA